MVSVYVSYAWKVEEQNRLVEKLGHACAGRGMHFLRDKDHLKYGDSIQAFMKDIGEGKHVVVVLSDAYLKSRYCMYELREIHRNDRFCERVLPIVLDGTRVEPEDQVDYLEFWETKKSNLARRLQAVDRAHTGPLNAKVDDYADFRRLLLDWLQPLLDMNALSETVHLGTDFAALLDRIDKPGEEGEAEHLRRDRQADEEYLAMAEGHIREILMAVPSFALILRDHAQRAGLAHPDDLAHCLCTSKLETVLDDVLRPAIERALPRVSARAMRESDAWEAAKSLLLWLSVFAVHPDWVTEQENAERRGESTLEIFVNTTCGIEIVSSRYRQTRPDFRDQQNGPDLVGKGAIALANLETGWSNDDAAIEQVLHDVAAHFKWGEFSGRSFGKADAELLNDKLFDHAKHKSQNDYIAVPASANSPLKRRDFYDKLMTRLPALTVIYMKSSGKQTSLLVDRESRLITIIREFLNIPDYLANKR